MGYSLCLSRFSSFLTLPNARKVLVSYGTSWVMTSGANQVVSDLPVVDLSAPAAPVLWISAQTSSSREILVGRFIQIGYEKSRLATMCRSTTKATEEKN